MRIVASCYCFCLPLLGCTALLAAAPLQCPPPTTAGGLLAAALQFNNAIVADSLAHAPPPERVAAVSQLVHEAFGGPPPLATLGEQQLASVCEFADLLVTDEVQYAHSNRLSAADEESHH